MKDHLLISIRMTIVILLLVSGIYPAAVWAVGQLVFPRQTNGSLITRNGKVIGSELLGQNFTADRYFHPRPSAAGKDGYDAMNSNGTNYGPTSAKLRDAIADAIRHYDVHTDVPADAVTSSASGLDPDISPANAYAQAARIARANGMREADVRALIDRRIEGRFFGVFGEPRVNVLAINLDLLKSRQ